MVENGLMSLSDFAEELRSEGHHIYEITISQVLRPLGITPKKMTNGRAKGVNAEDREKVRRFFNRNREPEPALAN